MKGLQLQNKKVITIVLKYKGGNIRVTNLCPVTNSFKVPQLQIPQSYPPIFYFCESSCLRCVEGKLEMFVFWKPFFFSLNIMTGRLIMFS